MSVKYELRLDWTGLLMAIALVYHMYYTDDST
jgi:hypothetical protein